MTLIDVLARIRALMLLPDNCFAWSGWDDVDEALAEFDPLVAETRDGGRPERLRHLFLPTGPLQELSLSGDWSQEYLALAARFDELFQS